MKIVKIIKVDFYEKSKLTYFSRNENTLNLIGYCTIEEFNGQLSSLLKYSINGNKVGKNFVKYVNKYFL